MCRPISDHRSLSAGLFAEAQRSANEATPARSSRPAPFELLESKLRPLQGRGGTVPSGTLIRFLEGSGATPAVVVSAGPRLGTTTLLAQWAYRSQRPFAWVSVDENDNYPIGLLTYVAIARPRPPLDPSVFEALTSPGVSVEATVVPRLGAALATLDRQVVFAWTTSTCSISRRGLTP